MKKTARTLLFTTLLVPASSLVYAQTPSQPTLEDVAFVNISLGAQVQTRNLTVNAAFPLNDETATITGTQSVKKGLIVDVSAGHRLWHQVFGAIGITTFHGKGDASVIANVPDPVFVNRPSTSTISASDLAQTTVAINLQAVWILPVTDKIDVSLALGPSIVRVKQDFVSVTVAPGSSTVTALSSSESKWTAKAGTVGIDLSYLITGQHRVGAFVRYAPGEVDLPSAPKLKVGGVQVGIGARLRF